MNRNKSDYDFIDFINYMKEIEPYITNPSKVPGIVENYLKQNPEEREKLIEKLGNDIWLIRAVLVKTGKHTEIIEKAEEVFPDEWMKTAYVEIFKLLENSIKI
ncbi:hypothetical protein CW713_04770 [Methanophagales archaeon]|nr:MAG: hypothetical protein CW713_04770 [Methanophagales archaeon]